MNEFELKILDFIARTFHCSFLDFFMPLITRLGDHGIFCIAVAVILLCFKKTRKTGVSVGLALIMGLVVGNLFLKNITARIRPYDLNSNVSILVDRLSDFSFPSGHTLASFETAVAIFIRNRRFGIFALVLAFWVAFSRLYLYVHYPTDVIAGLILGTFFAIASCKIVDIVYEKYGFDNKLKNSGTKEDKN